MGNSFGFLHNSEGGFQFTVVDACEAEGIVLNQICSLVFGDDGTLVSIGNVTRGTMKPQPSIAGVGIWFAMMVFFGIIAVAITFVVLELLIRARPDSTAFAFFREAQPKDPITGHRQKGDIFKAAGRTFVLSAADTQMIFIAAFLLGFAGQNKCRLTSYHFTVAVNQMMIALSSMTFSVALVRTYWRNPLAAGFRLLLSFGAFIGVGLTIFRKANYAPDWIPPSSRKDSTMLLPVACLLETELRMKAQAQQKWSDIGFGRSNDWPIDRYFFIALAMVYIVAHMSILLRHWERRKMASKKWTKFRGWSTIAYWAFLLGFPTFISVWCWVKVYIARGWVRDSGWIETPNTEYVIWDSGQLIAMGVLITVVMNVLTEMWKREGKPKNEPWQRVSGAAYEHRRGDEFPMIPVPPHASRSASSYGQY